MAPRFNSGPRSVPDHRRVRRRARRRCRSFRAKPRLPQRPRPAPVEPPASRRWRLFAWLTSASGRWMMDAPDASSRLSISSPLVGARRHASLETSVRRPSSCPPPMLSGHHPFVRATDCHPYAPNPSWLPLYAAPVAMREARQALQEAGTATSSIALPVNHSGHACFFEYGFPNTAVSADVGSSVLTIALIESAMGVTRLKSRYRA